MQSNIFSLVDMLTTSNALLLFNFILESKAFHEPKPLQETDQILKNRESIEKAETPNPRRVAKSKKSRAFGHYSQRSDPRNMIPIHNQMDLERKQRGFQGFCDRELGF
jgi:hypothetical protein